VYREKDEVSSKRQKSKKGERESSRVEQIWRGFKEKGENDLLNPVNQ